MTDTASGPTEDDANAPQTPIQLEDAADAEEFLEAHDLVLLEFVTAGCGICASMEPVLGSVARSAPGAVGIVNAGQALDLADEFGVQRVPTLVVLRGGRSRPTGRRLPIRRNARGTARSARRSVGRWRSPVSTISSRISTTTSSNSRTASPIP